MTNLIQDLFPQAKSIRFEGTCSVSECLKSVHAGGMCGAHYHRFKRHGDPKGGFVPKNLSPWDAVNYYGWTPKGSGCWEFNGPKNRDGYGRIRRPSGYLWAHRISYEKHNGKILDGMLIRHRCDNPPCINPGHLLTGTNADNTKDRLVRQRSKTKLSTQDVREIVRMYSDVGMRQRDIAKMFGISQSMVSGVVNRKRWIYLEEIEFVKKGEDDA